MLRIKLVKIGKKDRPTWKIVVVEKTRTGKGRVSDYIGSYNPHNKPKEFKLDVEKYEQWIKSGAQPTDAVLRLKGNLLDKNKEYQKEVKTKVYKKKKPEEPKKEAPKKEEATEEVKEEKIETPETPVEEVKAETPEPEAEKAEEKAE